MAGLLAGCVQATSSGGGLYSDHCASCHGTTGAGDGPWSAQLPVAPADLRFLSAANDGVFPAQDVITKVHGYRGRDFDAMMPEFGSVLGGAQQRWTTAEGAVVETSESVQALVRYLDGLQL
jgi:hypothetical protein